eukprot:gene21958-1274_t
MNGGGHGVGFVIDWRMHHTVLGVNKTAAKDAVNDESRPSTVDSFTSYLQGLSSDEADSLNSQHLPELIQNICNGVLESAKHADPMSNPDHVHDVTQKVMMNWSQKWSSGKNFSMSPPHVRRAFRNDSSSDEDANS